ncbi:MAG TPA: hypothetical protein VF263_10015 [Longimicrobiaceae bacterium]
MATRPEKTPKELLVEMRRAEVALAEAEMRLELTQAAGPQGPGRPSDPETTSRAAAAKKRLEETTAAFDAGRQAWEAFHAAEEEEQRKADEARISRFQKQPAR